LAIKNYQKLNKRVGEVINILFPAKISRFSFLF
jgi:hypothetical protein